MGVKCYENGELEFTDMAEVANQYTLSFESNMNYLQEIKNIFTY